MRQRCYALDGGRSAGLAETGLGAAATRGGRSNFPLRAPLSTGLERKSLGGHQIAVRQTTEIDRPSGTVNLTTVLMHTSGEWVASDWPMSGNRSLNAAAHGGGAHLCAALLALCPGRACREGRWRS